MPATLEETANCTRCGGVFYQDALCGPCRQAPIENPRSVEDWLAKFRREFDIDQICLRVNCNSCNENRTDFQVYVAFFDRLERYQERQLVVYREWDHLDGADADTVNEAFRAAYQTLLEMARPATDLDEEDA